MITEEMIEARRKENARKASETWRANNRERYNAYQRDWLRRFKEEHGETYAHYCGRKKAERELKQELGV